MDKNQVKDISTLVNLGIDGVLSFFKNRKHHYELTHHEVSFVLLLSFRLPILVEEKHITDQLNFFFPGIQVWYNDNLVNARYVFDNIYAVDDSLQRLIETFCLKKLCFAIVGNSGMVIRQAVFSDELESFDWDLFSFNQKGELKFQQSRRYQNQ